MRGLTSEEVAQRVRDGEVNDFEVKTGRTYSDIIKKNVLTPLNCVLFLLGALLLLCGEPVSAISATGIIMVNVLVSTIQEIRAKRRLDKIALLTRPQVTVLRDGSETVIDQSGIVKDDIVILRAGDQALVDGELLQCRSLEMDEALLTGESSTVKKNTGDKIYSGSICVVGEGYYRVTAFGMDSFASQMLSSAKKSISKRTPLEMETASITNILLGVAGVLLVISAVMELLIRHNSWGHTLEVFVLCIDIVPIALFLLITLTYMLAAVRMANTGVLLQRSNSVESISHVDTVCMDKTGTITTNRLRFEDATHFRDDAEELVSLFATATGSRNKTVETLVQRYGETPSELVEEIQFSSQRKYSAVHVRYDGRDVAMYMGAWNIIGPRCSRREEIDPIISRESAKGLRTVVVCTSEDTALDMDSDIPPLEPVSVITISDEVRSDCRDTISVFLDHGMDLKVISGDDPATVDALFSLADIPGTRRTVSGPELESMSMEEKEKTVLESNIFGRMKPENKEEVIEILKRNGRYVAMIGDGVNDVKSLKTAQVGVALESGSGAARGVADMVLVKDNFAALPKALVEGRRTVSGMRDILKLYLTRNIALALMFVATYLFVGQIPMIPIQNATYAFLTVSVVAFFMTMFAKPDNNKGLILPGVLRYALPSALMISIFGLIVYACTWMAVDSYAIIDWETMKSVTGWTEATILEHLSWSGSGINEIAARSAMFVFVSFAGIFQIMLVCPRWRFLSPNGETNKSLIPVAILLLMILVMIGLLFILPVVAVTFVGIAIFTREFYEMILLLVAMWFVVELIVLKSGMLDRFSERLEEWYIRKLTEEYTKGDVRED